MKSFWWVYFLLASPNLVVVDVRAQRQQEQQKRQQRRQQQQRQKRQHEERRQQRQQHSEYEHERQQQEFFDDFMNDDTFGSHYYNVQNLKSYGMPRHLLEAISNTLLISGPVLLVGTLSVIGFPLMGAFGDISKMDERNNNNNNNNSNHNSRINTNKDDDDDNKKVQQRVVAIIAGTILGIIIGASCWMGGILFGLWQLVAGAISTPKTLWSWIRGQVYWNKSNRTWQKYNLTEHSETLQTDVSNNNSGGSVRDDSLYNILEVSSTATSKEIKRAYYKLAKEYHPDKHPDKEEEFLKIHTAYETLFDPDSRKAYDTLGTTSDMNDMPVDTNIFFDVLFGVSPELEVWMGDLSVKSFVTNLCQLIFVAQQQQQQSGGNDNQNDVVMEGLLRTFFDGTHRTESRQVDIALQIRDFTKAFVDGDITKAEFEIICNEHASQVLESTPFPVMFMETIGKALYWQGRGVLQTPLDVPFSIMAWARDKGLGATNFGWYGLRMIQLVKDGKELYEKVEESIRQAEEEQNNNNRNNISWRERQRRRKSEEEIQQEIRDRVVKEMLPTLMDAVWRYNQGDITATLKGACWKLLHDDELKGYTRSHRQKKALVILGTSFLNVVKNDQYACKMNCDENGNGTSNNNNNNSGGSRDFMNDTDRLEVAIQMATSKNREKNAAKESEELLRERKKAKEEERKKQEPELSEQERRW